MSRFNAVCIIGTKKYNDSFSIKTMDDMFSADSTRQNRYSIVRYKIQSILDCIDKIF